ncbi:PREDICTED: protein SRC2-like [Camelina sativa]|uniref:Protein SRC2-like n=1 Tax=Camelina sativa TaxID=90675 RepID=A0ABM0YQG2_CAMSA|nr:PREDICTED: protein SRC2-like [Camelina sativa]
MANLTLELNIYSAKDLENVNLITKMDVYAVVYINGDDSRKNEKEKTPIDRTGESEPTWNHAVKFSVDQRLAYEGRLTLVVKLVCDRGIFGDKDLGEVEVPVLELLHGSTPSPSLNRNGQGMMRFVTYQVRTPFGKGQGSLTFSYRFNTPSFEPDSSVSSSSPVCTNPIHTPPDLPATTTTTMTYPPPPSSEASFYPPLSSIEHPPSSQPQEYSPPPYPYPNPYQYNSHYPAHPINIYPPPSPSASNLYPPPYYSTSPPQHQSYPPPPRHSYHQTQPTQSFHGYAPSSPQNHHGCVYHPPPPSTQNHHGCVYPPSPPTSRYGYGSPTTQAPSKNNNKTGLGLGMGAGLLGGALGGLLLGDLVSSDTGFDL